MSAASSPVTVNGTCAPGFEPVRDALAKLFADNAETRGVGVAATLDGDTVVDLWAGSIDRGDATPFTPQTLVPIFSLSKALTALVIAILVDDGAVDYDQPVADLWPEFAAEGKGALTVAQILSHQAGLAGFPESAGWSPDAWFDWERTTAALAAMTPLWPPGAACGYHPETFGFLAGEIARRASGRTVGQLLRDKLGDPFGLDLWIGMPETAQARAATPRKPPAPPDLGEINEPTRLAFLTPWASARAGDLARQRGAELPGSNGHGTALSVARALQPFARQGRLDETDLLKPETVAAATQERIAGPNLVLPFDLSFGAGVIRNTPDHQYYGPGERSVGHTGFGGSSAFADPDRKLTFAYVTLTMSPALVTDARAAKLTEALYAALH